MATEKFFELFRKNREKKKESEKKQPKTQPKVQPKTQSKTPGIFSREEIVELEEFPLEDIYYSKTYTFRMDTLIMAGVCSFVLLVIFFFFGRLSVSIPEEGPQAKTVVTQMIPAQKAPDAKKQISKAPSKSKVTPPVKKGNYQLQVLTSPTKKGAEEVVEYLKKNGFSAYVRHWGRFYMVRIHGFDKRDKQALQNVRRLAYKGRTWFDTAYFIKNK